VTFGSRLEFDTIKDTHKLFVGNIFVAHFQSLTISSEPSGITAPAVFPAASVA
jgi:hypothetical protein